MTNIHLSSIGSMNNLHFQVKIYHKKTNKDDFPHNRILNVGKDLNDWYFLQEKRKTKNSPFITIYSLFIVESCSEFIFFF